MKISKFLITATLLGIALTQKAASGANPGQVNTQKFQIQAEEQKIEIGRKLENKRGNLAQLASKRLLPEEEDDKEPQTVGPDYKPQSHQDDRNYVDLPYTEKIGYNLTSFTVKDIIDEADVMKSLENINFSDSVMKDVIVKKDNPVVSITKDKLYY